MKTLNRKLHSPKDIPSSATLSEQSQANKCKQALAVTCGKRVTQLSSWVVCRDFFTDSLIAAETGKPVTIYGYKALPEHDIFNTVLVKCVDVEQYGTLQANAHLLARNEEDFGFVTSDLIVTDDPLVLGFKINDPMWRATSWNLHWYSLFLKCLTHRHFVQCKDMQAFWDSINDMPEADDYGNSEACYLRRLANTHTYPKFCDLLRSAEKIKEKVGGKVVMVPGSNLDKRAYTMHNNFGIIRLTEFLDKRGTQGYTFPYGMKEVLDACTELGL